MDRACKFIRKYGDLTYSAAIYEQHYRGGVPTGDTSVMTQHDLQSVDIMPWPNRKHRSFSNRVLMEYHWTTTPATSTTRIKLLFIDLPSATGKELHPTKRHPAPVQHKACRIPCLQSKF